ncbi:hypothetical protein GJAV_G00068690 [Gymnothorax javanicus]|nr:hypothetical protein GJAV_G00068690 [Gymnothorax javanicus]
MAANLVSALIDPAHLTEKVPLDSGDFGHDVYLSQHSAHGLVLIKAVYTGCPHPENRKKLLLKEVEPLLKLNHRRIVRVLGVVLENGPSSLVMEFIPKGNLLAVLNEGTNIPMSVRGKIILEILEGMVYLTNSNFVHKDLKPQNILVGEDFHIKIADLGLVNCRSWSKLSMEESRRQGRKALSSRAGTLFYMAPEHLLSINNPFTEKSDVYSFAIIVWVILTKMEPYSHHQDDQVILEVCKGCRPDESLIPCATPVMIVTLMKKCWHQEPAKRPTFTESHKSFQNFYWSELAKNADRDSQSFMGLNDEMRSLALSDAQWQTDFPDRPVLEPVETSFDGSKCPEGLWLQSLQTDAIPVGHGRTPHDSIVSTLGPSAPLTRKHRQGGSTQASSNPQLWPKDDPPPTGANVTMRDRRSERMRQPEANTNCTLQPPNPRIRSWPVFPEPEATGACGAAVDPATAFLRQHSASVFIQHATGIQIGDRNQLTIGTGDFGEDGFEPSSSECSQYEELLQTYEDRPVRKEQLALLSRHIRKNWKCCARSLGLTNPEVETIAYDFAREGLAEMVHQMLEKWQMKTGTVGCTVGALCRMLGDSVSRDLLCELLLMCQGGAAL